MTAAEPNELVEHLRKIIRSSYAEQLEKLSINKERELDAAKDMILRAYVEGLSDCIIEIGNLFPKVPREHHSSLNNLIDILKERVSCANLSRQV